MTAPAEIERLVRIETKMDLLIDSTGKRGEDHENRLRALEQFRWKLFGGCAAVAAVVGPTASKVVQAIGG